MALTINQGFAAEFGTILPADNVTWADLGSSPYASWSNWTSWHPSPKDIQVTVVDDQLRKDYRIPTLDVESEGELTVALAVSDTGAFSGEETSVSLTTGVTTPAPQTRYYQYTITVTTDSNTPLPYIGAYRTGYNQELRTEILNDVDVPALPIDSTGFRLVDTTIGTVRNVQATALQGGLYVNEGYVLSNYSMQDYLRTPETITNDGVSFDTGISKFGTGSIDFSSSAGSYIEVDNSTNKFWNSDSNTVYTLEFWFYATESHATAGTQTLFATVPPEGVNKSAFVQLQAPTASGDFKLTYQIAEDPTGVTVRSHTGDLNINTWYHFAITLENLFVESYLNGGDGTAPTLGGPVFGEGSIRFGQSASGTNDFTGRLDEIRISQINRYPSPFTPSTERFYNDPDTVLLIHGDTDISDDGGIDYGADEYFVTQLGGIAMVQSKNPLSITVSDYEGTAWDGSVDIVVRGFGGLTPTSRGITEV